jgi:hypothetical protein
VKRGATKRTAAAHGQKKKPTRAALLRSNGRLQRALDRSEREAIKLNQAIDARIAVIITDILNPVAPFDRLVRRLGIPIRKSGECSTALAYALTKLDDARPWLVKHAQELANEI